MPIAGIDHAILQYFFSVRTPLGIEVFSAFTALGDTLTVGLVLLCAGLALLLTKRNKGYVVGLAVAVAGAKLCEVLMKVAIARARPEGYALFHLDTYSFPSGHATGAMALYGFIAYVLCIVYPKRKKWWIFVGAAIIAGVGTSRVYLGVHYPSDVFGGFLLGALWIFIGVKTVKYMRS